MGKEKSWKDKGKNAIVAGRIVAGGVVGATPGGTDDLPNPPDLDPATDAGLRTSQHLRDAREEGYLGRRQQERDNARAAKEALIRRADALSGSTDWRETSKAQQQLMDEWKKAGHAGKPDDDELWKRFQAARQRFFDARGKFYEERDKNKAKAKATKEGLVRQAERLAGSTDWRETSKAQQRLMDEWKKAGHAGKPDDDVLWKRFQAARQRFYDAKKRNGEEIARKRDQSKAAKERIVGRANTLAGSSDIRAAQQQMKQLMDEWKRAGHAGKEHEDRLWNSFNTARTRLRERADAEYKQRQAERSRKMQDAMFRKKEQVSRLRGVISDTQRQWSEIASKPSPNWSNPHRDEINRKRNESLSRKQAKIADIERKIAELEREIRDIDQKVRYG